MENIFQLGIRLFRNCDKPHQHISTNKPEAKRHELQIHADQIDNQFHLFGLINTI